MMRRLRRTDADDAGLTLPELLVSMFILTFVIGVFMTAVAQMARSTVRATVTVDAADSVRRVFQRLDKEVRYADAVNFPGLSGAGRQYVEFRVPEQAAPSGVTTCVQWRWDPSTKRVERRSWPLTASSLPAWIPVAEDVVADPQVSGPYPFALTPASPEHPRQSLTMRLLLTSDHSAGAASTRSMFVARNSTVNSPGNTDTNGDGVSDSPACWRTGVRP